MNTVLYITASGTAYETRAYTKADIDALVQNHGLHCLTSADRQFDFWFAAAPKGCQRATNTVATELLLATTSFAAKSVPLLHGGVVIATHDADGDLDGLSWQQLDVLAAKARSLSNRAVRVLSRRIARKESRRRRDADDGIRRRTSPIPTPVAAH